MISNSRVTIIIPTIARPNSIQETLRSLADSTRPFINLDVAVSVNVSSTDLFTFLYEQHYPFELCLFSEPKLGKVHALNRVLDDHPDLADIIVVMDDDISVSSNWLENVVSITTSWPHHYFFTGHTYIVWPTEVRIPDWATKGNLHGWAFSVFGYPGQKDAEILPDKWASGNLFWFRKSVIENGRRFPDYRCNPKTHLEMAEPAFMMQLSAEGKRGIVSSRAVCGHRIQSHLLQLDELERRAKRAGRCFGRVLLHPYRSTSPIAVRFKEQPLRARIHSYLAIVKWALLHWWHKKSPNNPNSVARSLDALVFLYKNLELVNPTKTWSKIQRASLKIRKR